MLWFNTNTLSPWLFFFWFDRVFAAVRPGSTGTWWNAQ